MLHLFGTKTDGAVSVGRDMNAKLTRKVLNVAFKQFQRLPDWPPIRTNEGRRLPEKAGDYKSQAVLQLRGVAEEASASRTFVE